MLKWQRMSAFTPSQRLASAAARQVRNANGLGSDISGIAMRTARWRQPCSGIVH
ncbi:hypothetical protein XOC_0400 [Xanthomonas oryzae pv. oryzicola BLS256]|uniref:Uncharacterized protein n=1 Tax=Xanthomonas oryzae pv. oryzicola (strain BLS256) TaxID=383407 RepID=G7TLL0_XANOB|nr:hypothetical protein XOC_0400 [Xanthomonas oryzae pv. oryzicola BLS256]QEO99555.1 hypothetical protein XOCgx_4568 [Xanthomonas oryzae pv. oryzicola]